MARDGILRKDSRPQRLRSVRDVDLHGGAVTLDLTEQDLSHPSGLYLIQLQVPSGDWF